MDNCSVNNIYQLEGNAMIVLNLVLPKNMEIDKIQAN